MKWFDHIIDQNIVLQHKSNTSYNSHQQGTNKVIQATSRKKLWEMWVRIISNTDEKVCTTSSSQILNIQYTEHTLISKKDNKGQHSTNPRGER